MAHRGKHPEDDKLFAPAQLLKLREAVSDLSFLMSRGYNERSAAPLVGNRYKLTARQIQALQRISCAESEILSRQSKVIVPSDLKGKSIEVDGYNLLIITEVALSGGYVFKAQDGCYRDIAGIHGTYKKVEETIPALTLIGDALAALDISHIHWFFDAPVSNSGRLKGILYELAQEKGYAWDIELVNSPDKVLAERNAIVVSSDGWILDQVTHWSNLIRYVVDEYVQNVQIVDVV